MRKFFMFLPLMVLALFGLLVAGLFVFWEQADVKRLRRNYGDRYVQHLKEHARNVKRLSR